MKVDIPSRIAIFRGGGFVGSHLVKSLADRQHSDIIHLDVTEEKLREIATSKEHKWLSLIDSSPKIAFCRSMPSGGVIVKPVKC